MKNTLRGEMNKREGKVHVRSVDGRDEDRAREWDVFTTHARSDGTGSPRATVSNIAAK